MGILKLNGIDYMGGGGGDSGMELTYGEYLALSEEEKTNGTTYYVKDINGVGEDQFQPIIYSEDEREIGVWTDGKPLYQKTTFITPGNTISMVGLSLKHAQCYSINTSGTIIPVPYNDGSYICWWMSSDAIRFATGRSDISQYIITYQYTKSTDSPGSGQWTPQGVPACHYSTEEQIVGTWVDGSTLYEKTIVTPTINNTIINIDLGFAIGMGIIVHGYYLLNDSSGSMISANQWFASNNFSWTHIELNTHTLKCNLTGYIGIGYITIRYTKTTS